MAINLHSKYEKAIATALVRESLISGKLNNEYSFSGVRTVKISTPQTVPLVDYTRNGTSRYGTPQEMQDTVQEMTMSQDKSFSLTVDKGNNADQSGIKAAGKMLALQIKERVVPMKDQYTFMRLAQLAGNVVGNPTALTKSTVLDRIFEGSRVLNDAEIPADGRTLYVPAAVYKLLLLSDEFIKLEALGKKSVAKGEVGMVDGMTVVSVPAGRWPANVNFMIVYKNSATAPSKINDTKLHQDPPGISGNLLEGRFYYDVFVIGARAAGIYVEVDTSSDKSAVLAAPTIAAATGAITVASGASCKFTTDGSDPRYSDTAQAGTAAGTGAGKVVKAYAYKEGAYPSPVAEAILTA